MKALHMPELTADRAKLVKVYRNTKDVRIRTRAQMVLLAYEQHLSAPSIAALCVKMLKPYGDGSNAISMREAKDCQIDPDRCRFENDQGLRRAVACSRPSSASQPWAALFDVDPPTVGEYLAAQTGIRSPQKPFVVFWRHEIVFSRPQHTISSPDPEYAAKKKAVEETRDRVKAGEVFYYADEFNVSLLPTLRAMWSPKGQQVMIRTPGQQTTYYGMGAVNYYTGETVVQFQRHKRRQETAQLLEALVEKHPTGTMYVAWDNANTHADEEVDEVVQAAEGRLVLLYLPTYSPWLNPIEMLLRHFRRKSRIANSLKPCQLCSPHLRISSIATTTVPGKSYL